MKVKKGESIDEKNFDLRNGRKRNVFYACIDECIIK